MWGEPSLRIDPLNNAWVELGRALAEIAGHPAETNQTLETNEAATGGHRDAASEEASG